MREIKFRVWSIEDERYLKKDSWIGHYDDLYLDTMQEIFIENPQYIREQYTGLKDKNGKMIREGDLVKTQPPLHNATFEIKYNPRGCAFRPIKVACDYNIMSPVTLAGFANNIMSIEVIGNKRDNRNLLNKED